MLMKASGLREQTCYKEYFEVVVCESVRLWRLLWWFVLHGFEHLVAGLVDFESKDARHVGVLGRRWQDLREDVWEEMWECCAEICSINVSAC